MKWTVVLSSLVVALAALSPLGCASEDPEPDPKPAQAPATEREQREQLYDDLVKAGAVSPQCNKGDFVCCTCAGGQTCCHAQ